MRISTEINSIAKIVGEEKAVELCAKAGFDAWDFSLFSMRIYDNEENNHPLAGGDYLKFARKLKQIGLDNGIVCNQSHAPFPSKSYERTMSDFKKSLECTAEAGGKICIVHPFNNYSAEENAEMYLSLLPFAKECGVKIATENMWNWDDEKDQSCFAACATPKSFNEHLDLVNDESFIACLDVGHAEMRGSETSAAEMIMALGKRLQALHLHDNDLWHDSHQPPFTMDIDFVKIVDALRKIDYKGDFTLEAAYYLEKFTEYNVFEGVKVMAGSARKLADMFEK